MRNNRVGFKLVDDDNDDDDNDNDVNGDGENSLGLLQTCASRRHGSSHPTSRRGNAQTPLEKAQKHSRLRSISISTST